MQHMLDLDGHCNGPLFAPLKKQRLAKRKLARQSGGKERWRKFMRTRPTTEDCAIFLDMQRLARIYGPVFGVQLSVDHIVPLKHPMVCGLHRPSNFEIIPLAENMRKSNHWPQQEKLL